MKVIWIIVLVLAVVAGWFVVLPAVAPDINEETVVRAAQVTAGDTLTSLNQSELALMMYDNAASTNATDTVILKKKGEMLIKCGRVSEAETVYQQVLSLNGNDPAALVRMGDSLCVKGNLTKAISYYDAALAVTPGDAKIWLKKGDAYLFMSHEETKQLQAAAKSLSTQPGSPDYQPASGMQIESMQSYQNAMTSYRKAMEIDPKLSMIVSARVLAATQNQVTSYQDLLNNF